MSEPNSPERSKAPVPVSTQPSTAPSAAPPKTPLLQRVMKQLESEVAETNRL